MGPLTRYADPGWYENPEATLASLAPAQELERDGVDPHKAAHGRCK